MCLEYFSGQVVFAVHKLAFSARNSLCDLARTHSTQKEFAFLWTHAIGCSLQVLRCMVCTAGAGLTKSNCTRASSSWPPAEIVACPHTSPTPKISRCSHVPPAHKILVSTWLYRHEKPSPTGVRDADACLCLRSYGWLVGLPNNSYSIFFFDGAGDYSETHRTISGTLLALY